MTYTINKNAKNVWVRDHADTEDLSVQIEASSVYTESGRTLEHELGNGSMVSNIAIVDSNMEKVIDGTYDGAYETCKMYGKSLVNISNKTQEIELLGRVDTHTQIEIAHKDLLKRNTKYILILSYDATFDTNSPNKTLYLDDGHGNTYIKGLTKRNVVTDSGKGIFVSVITTKDEEKTNNSNIHITLFKGSDGNRAIISNLMLIEYQEGMENWDIPYFTGLCDIKMPILHNVGKNLFEDNVAIQGYHNVSDTFYNDSNFITYKNPISVVPNTEYIFGNNIQTRYGRINFYDKNMKIISSIIDQNLSPFTTPSNCHFVRFSTYRNTGIKPSEIIWSQLEVGRIATPYEPYKTNILETSNDLVLRGLPSGIRDTYDCLTGEYIRRVGERDYQESDESDSNVITDLVKTHYELAEPTITMIEPSTTPFAYENGHIILESGHEGQSLLPTLEYQTVVSRSGQVAMIDKTIQQHERKITLLEKMLVQNIIDIEYKNTLLALKLEIDEVI